jgi:hypothetical protein
MPDQLPDIEKLLRLKRYERPPDGYFEAFLEDLHRRQRAELLKLSPWQLWRDRVSAQLHDFRILLRPGWLYAGAAVCLTVMIGVYFHTTRPTGMAEVESAGQRAITQESAERPTVTPIVSRSAPPRKVTPGVGTVSQESAPSENPNGLRRRPDDAAKRLEMIPLAVPPGETSDPAVNGGQVIILVR